MIWPPLLVRIAMTASGGARILSIALLICSVAPWLSIYAIISIHANDESSSFLDVERDSPLARLLRDNNATLEDLWIALVREVSPLNHGLPNSGSARMNNIHHWTVALPWFISLTLGIVVPFLLSLFSSMQRRQDVIDIDPDEDPWIARSSRHERRLSRLLMVCADYSKTLTKDDMDETDDKGVQQWRLPLPGSSSMTTTTRTVEGTCAICLGQYACGDQIIWSSNPKCQHVYHECCVLSWILRRRKQCPCCRRRFLLKADY